MKEFFKTIIIHSIGKAFIYSDKENARKMEYCISQNQGYQNCYIMVHRQYDFNKLIKRELEL